MYSRIDNLVFCYENGFISERFIGQRIWEAVHLPCPNKPISIATESSFRNIPMTHSQIEISIEVIPIYKCYADTINMKRGRTICIIECKGIITAQSLISKIDKTARNSTVKINIGSAWSHAWIPSVSLSIFKGLCFQANRKSILCKYIVRMRISSLTVNPVSTPKLHLNPILKKVFFI